MTVDLPHGLLKALGVLGQKSYRDSRFAIAAVHYLERRQSRMERAGIWTTEPRSSSTFRLIALSRSLTPVASAA